MANTIRFSNGYAQLKTTEGILYQPPKRMVCSVEGCNNKLPYATNRNRETFTGRCHSCEARFTVKRHAEKAKGKTEPKKGRVTSKKG